MHRFFFLKSVTGQFSEMVDRRIDVKLLQYELHNSLEEHHRGGWKEYWTHLQSYLLSQLSRIEFQKILLRLVPSTSRKMKKKYKL